MADVEQYKAEIKRTFALVEPISTAAAGIFYPTLWEVNPETKVCVNVIPLPPYEDSVCFFLAGACSKSTPTVDAVIP